MSHATVRILVVDDEPPIRKLLDVGLSSQGFAVRGAPNARSAIEMVQADVPDLVLLDLGLPDMRGHDLLALWRSENVPFPVIILSSRTDEAGIVQALERGADDYVTKPFGMNEL
ncbi:MAG: response regulator, partial [Pararhizobium sp.]